MSALLPQHHSRMRGQKIVPRGFGVLRLGNDQRVELERMVLDTYTQMVNAGYSLQETLAAIYLTGMENAVAASGEQLG